MTPVQIGHVRRSFALLEPIAPQAAALFYDNLFTADPELRKSLGEQGVEFTGGTSADADKFVRGEIDRWGKIIKTRGMSAN